MSFGVLADVEQMTLYGWFSTAKAYQRLGKPDAGEPMTDEDFDGTLDAIRALNLPDVRV